LRRKKLALSPKPICRSSVLSTADGVQIGIDGLRFGCRPLAYAVRAIEQNAKEKVREIIGFAAE
jgi:hypothetical protein